MAAREDAHNRGVADPASVVPAPGSQAIIQLLPRPCRRPGWRSSRPATASTSRVGRPPITAFEVGDPEEVLEDAGVLAIANPNNPDGRLYNPDRLLQLGAQRLLIVDEAFADVAPDMGRLARHAGHPNLVILRSFGKFLASPECGSDLLSWANRWPRACVARSTLGGQRPGRGQVALADDAWARAARVRLTAAAGRLDGC